MVHTAKIKGLLRENKKTQADLADAIGVSTATICQKLNMQRPISLEEAERMAEFLGIPCSEIGSYFFKSDSALRNDQ